MTGTIKLIRILLLMVIQHGGDDVSCKRSIHQKRFLMNQPRIRGRLQALSKSEFFVHKC